MMQVNKYNINKIIKTYNIYFLINNYNNRQKWKTR